MAAIKLEPTTASTPGYPAGFVGIRTETDVCVLATVLGAVDRGYRVVVVTGALCSSSDETHDALLRLYRGRYGEQVETTTASEIIEKFRA